MSGKVPTGRKPLGRGILGLAIVQLALVGIVVAQPGDVRALVTQLKRAVQAQDPQAIRAALEGLIAAGGAEAVNGVLELVPAVAKGNASDDTYWQLIGGASGFDDEAALAAVGAFLGKKKTAPFARDLLFGLENNPSPHVVRAIEPVLADGPYDMQLMAADQLSRVRTAASVDALIGALEREGDRGDPQLKYRIFGSLQAITGEAMGDAVNWIGWWRANRANGLPRREDAGGGAGGDLASQTLDHNRQREFDSITKNPSRIVVISATRPPDAAKMPGHDYNYDHMEQILEKMEIPHTVVLKVHFDQDPDRYLREAWTVLVNCNAINANYCICPECHRLLAEHQRTGTAGPVSDRMYTCPPECSRHENLQLRFSASTITRLKTWVEGGGYLFTEDWGVIEIVENAWPDLVTSNYRMVPQPGGAEPKREVTLVRQTNVGITPGRGNTSLPLLRGVFARPRPPAQEPAPGGEDDDATRVRDRPEDEAPTAPPSHQWQIDDESPSIHIRNREAVTVLMESEDLARVAGGDEAVAISFRWGQGEGPEPTRPVSGRPRGREEWAEQLRGGCVLHVISHFGHQQSRQEDTIVLQNLILNFIMESNRQHGG